MCVQPIFQEVPPEQVAEALAGPAAPLHVAQGEQPPPRLFRNHGGLLLDDQTPGTDKWAVSQGWVAVTPLGLRSDVAPPLAQDVQLHSAGLHNVVAAVLSHAAQLAGVRVGGIRAMSASNPGRYGTIVVPCLDAAAAAAAGAAPKGAAVAAPMDDDTFYVSPPAPTYLAAAAGTEPTND